MFPNRATLATTMSVLAVAIGFDVTVSRLAADAFPSRPIRLTLPSAAGTPPDIVSRIVASQIEKMEGWRIVIENKPGAMQTLGAAEVLKQPADGYSMLTIALAGTVAPALMPNVGIRLDADFVPVAQLASAYHVLVVHPSVAAASLPELVALLRAQPDKFTFSSGGFGTPAHLAGELFKLKTGVRTTHVPYQALPRAIGDLVGGVNHYQFITPLPVLDLIATGRLRALAVAGPHRMAALRDVPTVGEAGFPDLIIQDWFGIMVRRGTPDEIVTRLNTAINAALATSEVREAITRLSAEPTGGTPAAFGTHVAAQIAHWSKVVKDSGMAMHR